MNPQDGNLAYAACPECGCIYIDYVRDPGSGSLVEAKDRRLLTCRLCKHIFFMSTEQAAILAGNEEQGSTIAVDRACSKCGYNLRTLIIGERCPECGTQIQPAMHMPLIVKPKYEKLNAWDWAMVATFIFAAGGAYWARNNSTTALNIFAPAAALGFILRGGRGLHVGAISSKGFIFSNWKIGREAKVWSVIFIIAGVLILGFMTLVWAGIIW